MRQGGENFSPVQDEMGGKTGEHAIFLGRGLSFHDVDHHEGTSPSIDTRLELACSGESATPASSQSCRSDLVQHGRAPLVYLFSSWQKQVPMGRSVLLVVQALAMISSSKESQ